jgi:beta-N-acetylhexosaminidase
MLFGDGAAALGNTAAPRTQTPTDQQAPPHPCIPVEATATAQAVFDAMDTNQRLGQLIMVPLIRGTSPKATYEYVEANGIGGVLLLGNGWSKRQVLNRTKRLGKIDKPAGAGLLIAADQEGGMVQRLSGKGFSRIPAALTQGKWSAKKLLGGWRRWGKQLAAAGINLNLAPVADVVPRSIQRAGSNAPIGKLRRSFGPDPETAGSHAATVIEGLADAGIGSAIKHFPGLGRVKGNTDLTSKGVRDRATSATSASIDSFRLALDACPSMVMISHATYTKIDRSNPAAFSSAVITDLLRTDLAWSGVVISDALDAAAVKSVPTSRRAVRFIEAGGDIAEFSSLTAAKSALSGLRSTYADDDAFRTQADAAVLRVLTLKAQLGLIEPAG